MAATKRVRAIRAELESIEKRHKGKLRACDVVEFARDESTALHGCFQWDDTAAAHQYRLWQARKVIAVHVDVIHADARPFRVWVSPSSDRKKQGGGYRNTGKVLSDAEQRAELIADALRELRHFREKFRTIKQELAPIFEAIEDVVAEAAKPKRASRPRGKAGAA